MADTTLQVKIGLDDNISSGLKKIEGNFGDFNRGIQTNIKNAIGTIAKLGTVLGTAGSIVAGFAIKTSGDLQALSSSFTTLTGSVEEGQKVFKELKKLGASTPFETADLAKATQTMLSFGMSVQESQKRLLQLGDISLGNKDKLAGLTLAFAQVQSTGRLMGQDLLQMINNGFNPLQVISEKTGKSMAVLKKEMEQGKITAQDVAGAFKTATSEGGLFYKGMDSGAKTLNGTFSTLWDNIKNATAGIAGLSEEGTILKGSFLDLVQNGVNYLNTQLGVINWVQIGSDISAFLTTQIQNAKNAIDFLRNSVNFLFPSFQFLIGTVRNDLVPAFQRFGQLIRDTGLDQKVLQTITIGLVIAINAITYALGGAIWAYSKLLDLTTALGRQFDNLKNSKIGKDLGSIMGLFGRKAIGGIASMGGQYLVGETGPEMVTLPRGSRVTRSSETRDMLQSTKQGVTQNNYITMNNSVDWEIGTSILARKLRLS